MASPVHARQSAGVLAALLLTACEGTIRHDHHEYCEGVLPQSNIPGTDLDTLSVIGGCMYFTMAMSTLVFIRYAARIAARLRETGDDEVKALVGSGELERPVSSVIFPVFVGVLWVQFFISMFTGSIIALVPLDPGNDNSIGVSFLYAAS